MSRHTSDPPLPDAPLGDAGEVFDVAGEAVEVRDDEDVPALDVGQHLLQHRPVVRLRARLDLLDDDRVRVAAQNRVALAVEPAARLACAVVLTLTYP